MELTLTDAVELCTTLTQELANYFGNEVNVRIGCGDGAYHRSRTNTINYGRKCLSRMLTEGFNEYATVRGVWTTSGFRFIQDNKRWVGSAGLKGVAMLVAHEYAHKLQCSHEGERTYRSVHHAYYKERLRQVIASKPFESWAQTEDHFPLLEGARQIDATLDRIDTALDRLEGRRNGATNPLSVAMLHRTWADLKRR